MPAVASPLPIVRDHSGEYGDEGDQPFRDGAAGTIRSVFGDYQAAFLTSGALCLVTAAIVLQIGRAPSRMSEGPDELAVEPAVG